MSSNTLNVRIQNRTDTEANWSSSNPILLKGEMAISSDKKGMYKVGDGIKSWSELEYNRSASSAVSDYASVAASALSDGNGKQIDTTYLAGLNITEKTSNGTKTIEFTVTKGDETSDVISITDKDTTYDVMKAPTSSAAGKSGLVPAPGAGDGSKFLRADGTWVIPTNTTYTVMNGATESVDGSSGLEIGRAHV